MWILSFLPTWIFYAITGIGILGVIASYVLSMVPLVNQYKLPLQVVSEDTNVIAEVISSND